MLCNPKCVFKLIYKSGVLTRVLGQKVKRFLVTKEQGGGFLTSSTDYLFTWSGRFAERFIYIPVSVFVLDVLE